MHTKSQVRTLTNTRIAPLCLVANIVYVFLKRGWLNLNETLLDCVQWCQVMHACVPLLSTKPKNSEIFFIFILKSFIIRA